MSIQVANMNIIKFIQRMRIPDQVKVLGRWEITYCKPTMNKKIDLANEDHCGPCGQYIIPEKIQNTKINYEQKFSNKLLFVNTL